LEVRYSGRSVAASFTYRTTLRECARCSDQGTPIAARCAVTLPPDIDMLVRGHPYCAMATEEGPGPGGDAAKRVSPDPGFYADPGGQAGIRFWDGLGWSPLLPATLAGDKKVGAFSGPVLSPLPEPDGSWQYAAAQASRQGVWFAVFAAAAVLTLAAVLVVNRWWVIFAGVGFASRAFSAWKARKDFIRLDQAAIGAPLATADAASQTRRAGIVFGVWLTATAVAVVVMVALYARDLSKPQADFTLAVLALIAAGWGLLYTYGAWQRFNGLRQVDQAGKAAAGHFDTGDSTASPYDDSGKGPASLAASRDGSAVPDRWRL
jgi:Protein of unknown function (DUF2510)